jgi:hypothetical protein
VKVITWAYHQNSAGRQNGSEAVIGVSFKLSYNTAPEL